VVRVHPDPPPGCLLACNPRAIPAHRRCGAVAQLGERLPCTQEVSGSIPLSSTTLCALAGYRGARDGGSAASDALERGIVCAWAGLRNRSLTRQRCKCDSEPMVRGRTGVCGRKPGPRGRAGAIGDECMCVWYAHIQRVKRMYISGVDRESGADRVTGRRFRYMVKRTSAYGGCLGSWRR
jgi:hypothetical protein